MSGEHPQSGWRDEVLNDDLALTSRAFQKQSLDAVSKILAKYGIPNVVVTDLDRLQAGIIEAQFWIDLGNINEAKRTLAAALREQQTR